jgi:hypothetical protein
LLDLKIHLLLIRAPVAGEEAETAEEAEAAEEAEEAEEAETAAGEEEEEPRSYLEGGDLPVLSMIGEVHFCPPGFFVCPHLQQLHLQSTLQS